MPTPTGQRPEHPELSTMVATLCCYEERFGPFHPITLRLMTDVAIQLRHQPLLERAIRDVQRFLGRTHELRLRAIVSLRDQLIVQQDLPGAAVLQRELLERQIELNGSHHPQTAVARTELESLFQKIVESRAPVNQDDPRPRRVAVLA